MRDAELELPILRKHAARLELASIRFLERDWSYATSDHFGFMLISFLNKQAEHMRSVLVLVDARQYNDAGAIARMMIEGLCTLLWCTADRQGRALQWRAYALVSDWNILQAKKAAGKMIDLELEQSLRDRLGKLGPKYYTKAARKGDASSLPFPYQGTWRIDEEGRPIGVAALFDAVRGNDLYSIYEDFSQWIHWTPRGLGERLSHQDGLTTYDPESHSTAAQALAAAVQSLLQTLELICDHFTLGCEPSLATLQAEYLRDLGLRSEGDQQRRE